MDTIDGGIMMRYKPIEGDRIILGSFKKALGKALISKASFKHSSGKFWVGGREKREITNFYFDLSA